MSDQAVPAFAFHGKCRELVPSYWQCPHFKTKEGDLDMEWEHYECKVCGQRDKLDYEEMR